MIVDSFYTFLAAQAGVTSLCSQIFPLTIPEGTTPPAITFSLDADELDLVFDGQGGLGQALIEVNSWHTDHAQAHAIADAVLAALVNYRGALGTKTAEHIRLARKFELFETDSGLFRVSQQFLIAYH